MATSTLSKLCVPDVRVILNYVKHLGTYIC